MEPSIWLVGLLAFGLSFIFALGGTGSALVLVPILHWLGFPLNEAKPTCLFINALSMTGGSVSNFKHKRLDFSLALPIMIPAVCLSPVGAYVSTLISTRLVLEIFAAFLLFAGLMMLFFKRTKYQEQHREDRPIFLLGGIGVLSGFLSGLLGVGGGALIAPLMIFLGYNPKKVTTVTACVVPFLSFTGFIAYWTMGFINLKLLAVVAIAAYAGGFMGTHFMHTNLKPSTVKKFLGLVVLAVAFKILLKLFGVF
ncbi:MAG: sulfite exporter TauE/SafE family protein [Desulfonauticus sp.]|nr:sulfite exporter TauE/SafE family protein [Desulfonauticus sp.]